MSDRAICATANMVDLRHALGREFAGGKGAGPMAASGPPVCSALVDVDVTGINRHVDHDSFSASTPSSRRNGHAGPCSCAGSLPMAFTARRRPARRRSTGARSSPAIAPTRPQSCRTTVHLLNLAGELAKEFASSQRSTDVARIVTWRGDRYRRSSDAMALDPETQAIVSLRTWVARLWWSEHSRARRPTSGHSGRRGLVRRRGGLHSARAPARGGGQHHEEEAIAAALDRRGCWPGARTTSADVRHAPQDRQGPCYALTRREFGRSSADQETADPKHTERRVGDLLLRLRAAMDALGEQDRSAFPIVSTSTGSEWEGQVIVPLTFPLFHLSHAEQGHWGEEIPPASGSWLGRGREALAREGPIPRGGKRWERWKALQQQGWLSHPEVVWWEKWERARLS